MKTKSTYGIIAFAAFAAILSVGVIAAGFSQSAVAAPANKAVFSASNMTLISGTDLSVNQEVNDEGWVTIISGTIKTSTPSDLIVQHQQECAIHTGVNLSIEDEDQTSAIRQDVRLVVDDNVIPVVFAGENAETTVTLCSQAYNIETNTLSLIADLCGWTNTLLGDTGLACDLDNDEVVDEPFFNSYVATKETHGWNWVVLNVGNGEHVVEVQTQLLDNVSVGAKNSKNSATSVDTILEVGLRNLIITEEKFPVNAAYPTE